QQANGDEPRPWPKRLEPPLVHESVAQQKKKNQTKNDEAAEDEEDSHVARSWPFRHRIRRDMNQRVNDSCRGFAGGVTVEEDGPGQVVFAAARQDCGGAGNLAVVPGVATKLSQR